MNRLITGIFLTISTFFGCTSEEEARKIELENMATNITKSAYIGVQVDADLRYDFKFNYNLDSIKKVIFAKLDADSSKQDIYRNELDTFFRSEMLKMAANKLETSLEAAIEYFLSQKEYEVKSSVNEILIKAALFESYGKLINSSKQFDNKQISGLSEKLKKLVIKSQIKFFPLMRKNYGQILKDKLWEENIEVKTIGNGARIIEFTGGVFANNKNIKETYEIVYKNIVELRFNRMNFKWSKYANDYTYYNIKSLTDGKLKL